MKFSTNSHIHRVVYSCEKRKRTTSAKATERGKGEERAQSEEGKGWTQAVEVDVRKEIGKFNDFSKHKDKFTSVCEMATQFHLSICRRREVTAKNLSMMMTLMTVSAPKHRLQNVKHQAVVQLQRLVHLSTGKGLNILANFNDNQVRFHLQN